jgi:hypothetical protein
VAVDGVRYCFSAAALKGRPARGRRSLFAEPVAIDPQRQQASGEKADRDCAQPEKSRLASSEAGGFRNDLTPIPLAQEARKVVHAPGGLINAAREFWSVGSVERARGTTRRLADCRCAIREPEPLPFRQANQGRTEGVGEFSDNGSGAVDSTGSTAVARIAGITHPSLWPTLHRPEDKPGAGCFYPRSLVKRWVSAEVPCLIWRPNATNLSSGAHNLRDNASGAREHWPTAAKRGKVFEPRIAGGDGRAWTAR